VSIPSADDLVLSVSHTWSFQRHPDPLGWESAIICDLAKSASQAHVPTGKTMMFCDFVSITQRPFLEGQDERNDEQQELFNLALQAMPQLYIFADAVLHIERSSTQPDLPGYEEVFTIDCEALDGAVLSHMSAEVRVTGWAKDSATRNQRIGLFDRILSVNGIAVQSIEDYLQGVDLATDNNEPAFALVQHAPFGSLNSSLASERGWIYLERFCSMIKVAMVDESEIDRVAFSNSPEILSQIRAGGMKLKRAAMAGEEELKRVLKSFVEEMKGKKFNGVSMDALISCPSCSLTITRDRGNSTIRHENGLDDRTTVAKIMTELVAHLAEHWSLQQAQQRQRQLVLAVNRGDVQATEELLNLGADPNLQDARGTSCLHTAAKRGDREVALRLLQHGANRRLQDSAGQAPAYLIPLWVDMETVDLFDILVEEQVLSLKTHAGVSVFEHFWVWSETACRGKPFEALHDRLRDLVKKFPHLQGSVCLRSFSPPSNSRGVPTQGVKFSTHFTSTGAAVHTWAPEGGPVQLSVVILNMQNMLPWSMQKSSFDGLAAAMVKDFSAQVFAISRGAHPLPREATPLARFLTSLVELIDELPLKEPFVLVDNSFGIATSLLWPLRRRLLCALVINACGIFAEEYVDSAAHHKFSEILYKRAEDRRQPDRDVEVVCETVVSVLMAGGANFLAELRREWYEAVAIADEEFWSLSIAQCQWLPKEQTEAFNALLPLDLEATLACSALGPTVVMSESMRNLHRLLPNASFQHIKRSRGWWELENPHFVTQELVRLLRRVNLGLARMSL